MTLDLTSLNFGTSRNGGSWPSLQDAARGTQSPNSLTFGVVDDQDRCSATSTSIEALMGFLELGWNLAVVREGKAFIFEAAGWIDLKSREIGKAEDLSSHSHYV